MDKAKAAISDFMGRSGHHDTTVHENVAPAVEHETVKPHQHENITTAVDKEVHQDHYHRTVQPVHDREVLPETHEAKLGGVQHREFDHRDHDHTKSHLAQDQAQFQNQRTVDNTTSSRSVAPAVGGEHVHHHIHETIQPVLHKETIQPNVVHTTVPIHEVHHNKATHHDTTALPAMSMDQFKSQGGSLQGREERTDQFEGVPKGMQSGGLGNVRGMEQKHGHQSKEHAHHGDYHDVPNHGVGTDVQKGGLTSDVITGSTGGTTGHHTGHHHQHGTTGVAAGAATGAAAGAAAEHHHHGQHHTGATGATGATGTTGSTTNPSGGLTGSSTSAGLSGHDQSQHADRGMTGQGNLTGSSTQGGVTSGQQGNNLTSNRESNVNSSNTDFGNREHAAGVIDGIGGEGKNELAHREGESGELPKALTEEKSKFVPMSSSQDDVSRSHKHHEGKIDAEVRKAENSNNTA